jgi:hypothetical protein
MEDRRSMGPLVFVLQEEMGIDAKSRQLRMRVL